METIRQAHDSRATNKTEIDFDAHYAIKGYRGIAWSLIGYKQEIVPTICYGTDDEGNEIEIEDWSETESIDDTSRVVAVMVGDDRKFTFDLDEIEVLEEQDFCHVCGQIGCSHDGIDRS